MNKSLFLCAAFVFSFAGPLSAATPDQNKMRNMEQCKVVDKDGNNLIRAGEADSGNNADNDDDAWIWVPAGQCAKLNAGDFSGVGPGVKAKIHPSSNVNAATLED